MVDPAVLVRLRPGSIDLVSGPAPRGVPTWAWGYSWRARNGRRPRVWINPNLDSDTKRYTIVHELGHQWIAKNGTRAMRRALKRYAIGQFGSDYKTQFGEWFAHNFARSVTGGSFNNVNWGLRIRIAPSNLPAFKGVMLSTAGTPDEDEPAWPPTGDPGGGAPAPVPFPIPDHRARRRSAFLRSWPGLAAPVIRQVASGGRISTGRGRTGSATEHGSWWLEVVAVDGSWIEPALWVPGGEVRPLRPSERQPINPAPAPEVTNG